LINHILEFDRIQLNFHAHTIPRAKKPPTIRVGYHINRLLAICEGDYNIKKRGESHDYRVSSKNKTVSRIAVKSTQIRHPYGFGYIIGIVDFMPHIYSSTVKACRPTTGRQRVIEYYKLCNLSSYLLPV
jgi:hypothetical protein